MRPLLVVLASGVTAGLAVFFVFNALGAIGLSNGSVYLRADVFVCSSPASRSPLPRSRSVSAVP
jgi:hypothetical protein